MMASYCTSSNRLSWLLLRQYFKNRNLKSESGFTLLEVLISILIGTIFVAASLQLIVFSAVFRVKAQESSEAKNLVVQNIDTIRSIAAGNEGPITPCGK